MDFVIPCHPKDFCSLQLSVDGIRNNIAVCDKIFVISEKDPKIFGTTHIPEENYSKYITKEKIHTIWENKNPNLYYRSNWLYQQFLKLFSVKVIHNLSESFVLVDSDTIFLKDISFDEKKFYYCIAEEYHTPYLPPTKLLLDVEDTIGFSCISHHMIFNKKKINQLLEYIENRFDGKSFADCILDIVDYNEASCFSEWDLYANYMLIKYPEMCNQRQLIWKDIDFIPSNFDLDNFKIDYDFVSCHAYRRNIK
jgi:hypothetical protein